MAKVQRAVASDPQSLHRSVFCMDNLHVLRGMDSESVDLIYPRPAIQLQQGILGSHRE